jgi:hypothetical protein
VRIAGENPACEGNMHLERGYLETNMKLHQKIFRQAQYFIHFSKGLTTVEAIDTSLNETELEAAKHLAQFYAISMNNSKESVVQNLKLAGYHWIVNDIEHEL